MIGELDASRSLARIKATLYGVEGKKKQCSHGVHTMLWCVNFEMRDFMGGKLFSLSW